MNLNKLLLAAAMACAVFSGASAQTVTGAIEQLPIRTLSHVIGHDGGGHVGREPVTDFLKPGSTSPITRNLACWGTSANLITDCGTPGSMAYQNSNAVSITGGAATFTGVTTAPTKSQGDNSTNVATTAYVDVGLSAKASLVGGVVSVAQGGTNSSTAAGARTNLGLGTIATQNSNAVSITGGSITGITDLAVSDGGTGSNTAAGARTNLGAAASGANGDITSITGLTTALSVAQGGTGATSAGAARTGLGAAASGSNSDITSLSGLTTALSLGQGGTGGTTQATARAGIGAAAAGANSDITSLSNLTTPLSVAQGGTGTTTSTGTGAVVRSTGPSISNPSLTGTVTIGGVTQVFPTSGLLAGTSDTQTFTGKTFDTAGSGNVFKINGTQISSVTGTGSAVLATAPSISGGVFTGGSINNTPIGATTPNTGAFTTLSMTGATTQSATSQFYQNLGANVNRINDRLFVGPAALNNGTNVASQPDWLTTYQLAKGRTYGYIQTSQFSVLNTSAGKDSLTTAVFGAQTSGRTASQSQVIAATGVGVNNNSGNTGASGNQAWGGYFEGWRDTTTAGNGGAYGIEADAINLVGIADTDPYSQSGDQTISAQLASGGEVSGAFDATAAINIQNNGAAYRKGIVFGSNSITGSNGTSGSGIAIAFGYGHTMQWYGAAGVQTSSILSNGTTSTGAIQQLLSDNIVTFRNASSKAILNIQGVASGVNGVQALGAATGQAVALQAVGDDTNIPMQIQGKGTSGALLQGGTAGVAAPSGYIGQIVNSDVASPGSSLTSGTPLNVTSASLPAGAWQCYGNIQVTPAGTTTIGQFAGWISTTSAAVPTALETSGYFKRVTVSSAAGLAEGNNVGPVFFNFTSATTVYLTTSVTFSTSTATAYGALSCVRFH
ncbi:beta strand repeat-containing protein [Rhizobium sp. No.120]